MSESDHLAIVGMSCRYPGGVRSPEDLWQVVVNGREVLSSFPRDRGWNLESLHDDDPGHPGTSYVDRGGFLDDVAGFDSGFFGISAREATAMDPQQRLLLEVAWEALERAGLDPLSLRGSRTGVFVGGEPREYGPRLSEAPDGIEAHLLTGTTTSVLSGRIAYSLGLHGPALTVDTSASSSLVALHLAAQALRHGECSLALAGGVSVMATPGNFVAFSRLRGLAPDGRCKPFSADADGTAWSEGVGVLVLERLPDALRNGHRVLALVRGTAINSDGASDGLTAPNGLAQADVIARALADAGLTTDDIDAVEAHGTGTPLGDRTESRALAAAYGRGRSPERPLLIGSVKSNIGHTQAAAGVAGVIKTVMALRHGVLPATLNIGEPNPHIDWSSSGLRLLTEARPWPESGRARRAGVSSFGISGTNAHAVLEQAPPAGQSPADDTRAVPFARPGGPTAWLVSARSATALSGQAGRLAEFVAAGSRREDVTGAAVHGPADPADVAWSLATTRSAFEHRAVIIGSGSAELTAGLEALAAGRPSPALVSGVADPAGERGRRVVFVFPGQGSQWLGMGRDLAAASPVFAARLGECERALSPYVDWNLSDVLAGADGAPGLDRDDVVQPALFAVMVSLAAVWQAAGVTPEVVAGHSQGEIAAACVAGILSLEDAAKVTALRSRMVRALAGYGGMLSIAESPEAVTARLAPYSGQATVGVVNSPDATVITGDLDVLGRIAADCERDGVRTRLLPVDYASHSPQVDRIRDDLLAALAGITPGPGTTAMVSAVTGEFLDGTTAGAEYWYANLRRPVRFANAVRTLDRAGYDVFVEVSPHPVLTGAISATLEQVRREAEAELDTPGAVPEAAEAGSGSALLRSAPVVTGTLRRDAGGQDRMLASLAEVHVRGVQVDWPAVLPRARRIDLPTYAFEHRRFWLDAGTSHGAAVPAPPEEDPVAGSGGGLRDRIAGLPAGEQVQAVLELIRAHAAAVLGQPTPEAVQPGRTFKEIGFDSLAGVELRTRLNAATGLELPTTLIFDYPTPAALTGFLRARLLGAADVPLTRAAAGAVTDEPIAIVAMSCRFPGGVHDPESLWELLAAGGDAIGDVPTDRGWDLDVVNDPDLGPALRGGYLSDVAGFDPAFFGISPREALAMDPQQRLLLEISWEALERAGIDVQRLRGSATGVFVGAASSGYGDGGPRELEGHLRTGGATSVLSGRVAYTFGFEGPAVTVDTACSSSLVALHLAAQALRNGECGLALAGGVTVHATASWLTWFARQHGLASDGRCKAFSAAADGMGMAEGAGVVLLERLSDAHRNGHPVLAVVAGSAVNQDGASNGLTAPNGPSQQRVIRAALAGAGLGADDVDVVEAHGTGTVLGDPIEAQALLATYGQDRDSDRPLLLGTVKSNIGHTQWAAGAAGIIKMVLALRHGTLPRTLHADVPSPHVDWSSGAVRLLTEPQDWPERGRPRRAGVSAFGISGTNAHVILEQAPDDGVSEDVRKGRLPAVPWLLSARDETGLAAQARRLREYVLARPELDPADVGWSLATTRTALPERAVVVGADRDELISGLADLAAAPSGARAGSAGRIGFVFTGQGAQRIGMGRRLYAAYPAFAAAFDEVCAGLEKHLDRPGLSLKEVIGGAGRIDDTVWAQAGLFAVEVAVFRLLESWGVTPAAMAGHSIGELAAAHLAGVWSLADACAVVAARGRLMQALPPGGAMLSVQAGEDDVRPVLAGAEGVEIAAVNGPEAVVVSGPEAAVSAVEDAFSARGVRVRRLRVSHAFHSPLMEPMLAGFADVTASVSYAQPRIPIVSTLTGRPVTDELLDPGYWVRQVREPVRFADAVTALRDAGVRTFVEIGPDAVLTALGSASGESENAGEDWIATLRRDRDEAHTLVSAVGRLAARGGDVDWSRFYAGTGARRVDLPTYAFDRQRYWLTPPATARPRDIGLTASGHPLLGTVVELPANGGLVLTGRLSLTAQPWLADHVVAGRVVVPGAALVEMAIRAGDEAGCSRLAEMIIQVPMVLPARRGIQVRITVGEPDEHGDRELTVHSRPEDETGPWTGHATGVLAPAGAPGPDGAEAAAAPASWPPRGAVAEDLTGLYPALARAGLPYGPAFQGVRRAWRRGEEIFAEVGLGEGTDLAGFGLHPALLDAALHLIARPGGDAEPGPLLPFAWTDAVVHATGASTARVRIAPSATGEGVSLTLADESGGLIATVGSLVLRPMAAPAGAVAGEALFELDWVPAEPTAAAPDPSRWAVLGSDRRAAPPEATAYDDVAALLAAIGAGAPVPEIILFRPRDPSRGASGMAARARGTTLDALRVVQEVLRADELSASRLLVLTERAVDAGAVDVDVTAAGVWGLVRVAQSEHPDRIVLADLDDAGTARTLAEAVSSREPQIAVRAGRLLAPRLARVSPGLPVPEQDGWRLECTERGTLENIVLAPAEAGRRPLARNEVRVALRAAGVNFRDVLNVLGMYPGDPGLLGLEGAGVVLETGPDVTGLRPGDLVMGLFSGAFTPVAVTDARLLAPVPAGWTLAEAAAAPVVYLTAWHALVELAGLRAGESVLIHAAAGGVGSAAVQVARHLGAEVFGTAGPSKWGLLREAGLDEAHLASSRTLDFETRFPAGIDVVLNSLAGEFTDASLRLAAGAGGRFIEIGKTDIRDAGQVARDHQGLAYQAFDLLRLDPERIARMFAALSGLFARQVLRPLPVTCWDVRRAPEAFRYLSQARNVGKVVLTMPAAESRGTTLVTGVSGALGGLIARHLASGATRPENLLLLSRRGPDAPGMGALAAELATLGAGVRMVAADVADHDHVAAVLAGVPAESPLRAVVHAAGVLDDGVVHALTPARIDAVMRPKADGAWNLHRLTRHLDLDRFVLFSSVAGLWGNPGQAGYAAANTFLDALAGHRRRAGLPATSLAWGPWQVGETPTGGMAANLAEADWRRMARHGLAPLTGADGLGLLDAAAALGQAMLVPARLDLRPGAAYPALLSGLTAPARRTRRTVRSAPEDGRGEFAERLAALPEADRGEAVQDLVRTQAALVLGMSGPAAVEAGRSFRELGIDSLTAVELRNRLNTATGLRLPAGVVFDYPTPALLAGFLATTALGTTTGPASASTTATRSRAEPPDGDQIAIVGIGCRFPGGAGSAGDFWDLVSTGTDAVSPFPRDRGPLWEGVFEQDADPHARVGAFLYDAGDFDAQFFGISPREALAMDPQQRLLLETSWEALEDAGIDPLSLHGSSTGVFAGLIYHDYGAGAAMPEEVQGYLSTGGSGGVASGRVAYALGLEGPAVTVDTACSSSLVALHLAVQALRSGECDLALAGGVTVMATPGTFLEFARQRGLAADGRCKAYAQAADGTGWGEGVGVLVVERLSDARRNGHRVLAVVAGTAVNQDGASNGLTAPSGPSQQRVIRAALDSAGLRPGDVDVIEGHGTGTRLGDPIEAEALIATYGQGRDPGRPVLLGSVKSNIGHTQAAAGVAGVIKMVQAMAHGVVPATLHVDEPSAHVDWDAGSVRLVTEATAWPETGRPRRAGVSSFGFSGTNAHIILEQAPGEDPDPPIGEGAPGQPPVLLWPISARSTDGLAAQADRLREFLLGRPELDPVDVGWSLATARAGLPERAVVLGSDRDELLSRLAGLAAAPPGGPPAGVVTGRAGSAGKVGFVFTGQGAQRIGMGRRLYAAHPVFAQAFDAVCAGLDEHLEQPVRAVVHGAEPVAVDQTMWAQAGLFAVEVALFRLLESWGVTPAMVAGHSIGELAAAHVAGVWSLADACAVVAARGRLMQALPAGGAMLSVRASEDEVRSVLAGAEGVDGVDIAAVNGPDAIVVSGAEAAVSALEEEFSARGVRVRRPRVSHAFHSPLMEPMLAGFAEVTASVSYAPPRIPIVSTLTGRPVTDEALDPAYWVRQVREPVRFAAAVTALRESGVRTFVEIGPDAVLTALGSQTGDAGETWIPVLRRDRDEAFTLASAVAEVQVRGGTVDWPAFYAGTGARRVDLPTYAFARRRYWLDAAAGTADPAGLGQSGAAHPLLGASTTMATGGVMLTGRLSLRTHPWLGDHVVAGRIVVPGAALVEMAVRAGDETGQTRLAELVIDKPLILPADGGTRIQVTVEAADETGRSAVGIYSQPEKTPTGPGAWTRHATGVLAPAEDHAPSGAGLTRWPPAGAIEQDLDGLYPALAESGLGYGPAFRAVRKGWRRGEEVFAEVALGEGTSVAGFAVHPALLDACLHLIGLPSDGAGSGPLLPFAWTDVVVHATDAATVRVRLAPAEEGEGMSVTLADETGVPVASVRSLVLRPLPATGFGDDVTSGAEALFEVAWIPARLDAGPGEATGPAAGWAVLAEGAGEADGGDLDPDLPGAARYADVAGLLTAVAAGAAVPEVVVLPVPSGARATGVPGTAHALAAATLGAVQDWLAAESLSEARLLVVTRRAVDAGPGAVPDPASASVHGLIRVAAAENPGRIVLADIDEASGVRSLLAAGMNLGEPEFAVRQGEIRLPRLGRPADALPVPADAGAWRLGFTERGTLENLVLVPAGGEQAPLGPGQVRVGLRAAGVNFRDVLNVLGMYPGDAGLLGLEGAGIVLETGPGVTGLTPGDQVMGLFTGAFGPVGVTDQRLLVPVPAGWTLTEAAAAPVAFLTAYYALVDLAGLDRGESVLIHAAAGGVGIAAVQLARYLGAEVFGTAGPSKWPVLRELGLPEMHVASSRTLDFEDAFRAATGGAGVDVVLDSLAGPFVDASARLAAGPGRRFIEMGKTDVRDPERIAADHDGLVYRAFDLFDTDPDRIAEMFAVLSVLFAQGDLRPLPVTCWDVRRAPEAFRYLSQARNVGKIVLTVPAPTDPAGTVLITGASGALGALVARHLAGRRGVRSLALLSRRGPQAPGMATLAADLAGQGVTVRVRAADVADRDQLAAILAGVPESAPLRGVVHAAGLLDDGVITSLTPAALEAVMRPKVDGAWHLHELTRSLDLDLFVLFSSIAGIWGNPGQGNYAAANTFLDALAACRRAQGLPAVSLAWGPWEQQDGMTAALGRADWERLGRSGALPLPESEGLALLDAAAATGKSMLVPVRLDPAALEAGGDVAPLLSALIRRASRRRAGAGGAAGRDTGNALADRLAALPEPEREAVVLDLIHAQAALVLGLPGPESINAGDTFKELGVDSLTALELRNRLNTVTGLRLPATLVFDYPTPATLAGHIRAELAGRDADEVAPQPLSRAASAEDDVAIVGIGCRFPGGAGSAAEFWRLLADGTDTVAGFPQDRGPQWAGVVDPDPAATGKSYASEGAFLYDAGDFDAQFFGISPREALAMDPQQRLLLETSWEALEHAGIDPVSLHGSETGVFAGLIYHDYGTGGGTPGEVEGYVSTGTSGGVASGRVAYALGLEGPAVTVDTACSSSLVAVHLAAQALRSGECTLALAGGVTVMATPGTFVEFSRQRGLAADGRCKAYADAADGTGWGEGVGVLVLERLSDARRNGHRVLAVVRGSAMNQDGASNGLTAPNGPSQQRVIRAALANAGLRPGDVDVVEGHGTGTRLGDPIEAQALLATYGQDRDADRPVLLGSVKSNIGHTQAAAGVAGIIKMVLAMAHGVVPATLHVDAPSSHVDWEAGAVRLATEATAWPETGRPRRAGVSSFGFSGTNAHVILEQAPDEPVAADDGQDAAARPGLPVVPWLVSARSRAGLAAQAARLAEFVSARSEAPSRTDAADIGWSLATTRPALSHRAVVVGTGPDDLRAALTGLAESLSDATTPAPVPPEAVIGTTGSAGKVGFVFTGQGAQRPGMGQGLYAAYPAFADAFDAVIAGLEEHLDQPDHSLREVIQGDVQGGAGLLDQTVWAQAGLFAIEVALFRLLESWKVTPAAVAGHSIGELAAAHVAGVWSLPDACAVVAARGRLMQALPAGGAMLAVSAAEDDVLAALSGFPEVGIAAVNGPEAVVVSGPEAAVGALAGQLSAEGRRVRRLRVSHAFHSSLMEPMLAGFAEVTRSVSYAVPRVPLVSTLTGTAVTTEVLDPEYWVRQVREPVRFADAVATLRESGVRTFVEIGPDGVLSALGAQSAGDETAGESASSDAEAWVPALRRTRDEARSVVSAVGRIHVRGGAVDWTRLYAGSGARRVDLPTYAFTRQTYWLNPASTRIDAAGRGFESSDHPLLGAALDLSAGGGLVMTGRLSPSSQPWLADHVVAGQVVVPGAALVEMAVRAGHEAGCARLRELVIRTPLVLSRQDAVRIQVTVAEPGPDGDREVTVHSRREDDPGAWTPHATGVLAASAGPAAPGAPDMRQWPPADATGEDLDGLYPALAATGLAYGPLFRGVRAAWRRGEEIFAEVALGDELSVAGFGVHPVLLDAALHLMGTAYPADGEPGPMLPFAWTDVEVHSTGATAARVRLAPAASGEGMSVTLADETGALIASIGSLVLRALPAGVATGGARAAQEALFELDWVPARAASPGTDAEAGGWAVLGTALDLPGVARYPDIEALTADRTASPHTVILPCGLDDDQDGDAGTAAAVRATTAGVLAVVRSWLAADDLAGSRLVLLTRQAVDAGATAVDLAGAGVWGLGRVAAAENPGRIVLVDLDAQAGAMEALTAALAAGEAQVAVRAGQVLVPRLARATTGLPIPAGGTAAEGTGWRLECTGRGTLENLALVPAGAGTRTLAAGEVRVGLRAAGVNFRDVLNVLGMYPGEAGLLGLEGAGVVLEVGPGVTGLRPGDRVMGLFSGAFGPVAVTDARLLAPVPAGWTMAEAAAAPVVYLTAWYALVVLAGLRAGESVLIHAAAGGVGIAAVQVARYLGADVFGTASPPKWPVLHGLGLSRSRVASSRTVEFEDAFRTATGGSRIDVVLNSLAGEFVDASLRLAAGAGGRFVEMGKTDVRDPQRVAADHEGLSYQAFDLLDCAPDLIAGMFAALSALFEQGILRPLPVASWDVRRAPEAFRYLSQGRNVGKVVLTIPAPPRGGTVLVTGASGALGGLVARHLAAAGNTESLVLLSRRGPAAPGAARLAAGLAESGVRVQAVAGDAADRDGLGAVLADIADTTPLRGVVHAAGVLDDAVIGSLTPDMIESVMRPKVDGAWNLHELTRDLDLDLFALFSSSAGICGNPGQGNYAAANTALDALAVARRRAGLAASSLAWGPWELDPDVTGTTAGMAGTLSDADRRRLARQGFVPLTAADGLALLDLATGSAGVDGHTPGAGRALLVPARFDRAALRDLDGAGPSPVLAGLIARPASGPARRAVGASPGGQNDFAARLAALGPDDREKAIRDLVVTQAALVLGLPGAGAVDIGRSFRELGFDSLTAVELRNRLGTATGLRLGAAVVFDHPTPDALTAHINRQLGGPAAEENIVLQAFSGLEKVESALTRILQDDAARTRVTARVQELLSALRKVETTETEEISVADRIEAAGDDDIFEFIDKELGI
ncbi:acyl transferase domain-containing protein/NADPH:quinone reductase-like Zn-dependent oxidoreductase/short-subunit dehydrogenase [Thermocatellispora tengchongensis]|uniref:Acyl transferase domain-containing protein/NADPH:quinone reductase-like Zn-dependent oxidoreductase/short-subunit dehydrogenase n=2 Tax=Thermocatellispora tengchongensis TaxID=1073253 RepID=A0A840PK83_9ACTN|nr:type I polyketide synthase [Thermocatellispora tengchongensis]MBB5137477.1 acyl transferase domain-containing protein/NADPH:quinone reductase-like Zn-dependent oxidoreductase/short-subunit dehydrogenase [Thermocatellispora tengchongensis]